MSIIEKLGITPGPWEYDDGYGNGIYGLSVGGCRKEMATHKIADIRGWGHLQYREDGEAIMEGNTRLITAAPEMLEAIIRDAFEYQEGLDKDPELYKKSEAYPIFLERISIIESATGKTWAEIKELI